MIDREADEPLVTMSKDGIRISHPEVMEKLEKKSISPSLITGLEGCHARWVANTFVTREILPEPLDNEARRGVLFHKVMEDVNDIEPKDTRTKSLVKQVMIDTLKSEDFLEMGKLPEVRNWLSLAVRNYYEMGGDPTRVDVAHLSLDSRPPKKGLEMFVKGKLGGAERDILGYVDLITEDPTTRKQGRESVVIGDWKTGAKVKEWKAHTKSTDGLAEQRQQIAYTKLLRNEGVDVSGARLIYPVAQKIVTVDMEDTELFDRVDRDVKEADEKLDTLLDTNLFEFKPDFLCAWCPLAKICPSAQIKPYKKMQDAYAKQPAPEELAAGIEII